MPSGYYEFGVGYNGYTTNDTAQVGDTTMVNYALAWSFTVPEPSTLLLAGMGMTTLFWRLKRKPRDCHRAR